MRIALAIFPAIGISAYLSRIKGIQYNLFAKALSQDLIIITMGMNRLRIWADRIHGRM